jgi:hypothetical protein
MSNLQSTNGSNTKSNSRRPIQSGLQGSWADFLLRAASMDLNGLLISASITAKTERCIKNLKEILEEAGSGIHKVVKVAVRPLFHLLFPGQD